MAQHGYLREYDEGWDRGDERDRWRSGKDDRNERNLNFMLGDRARSWDRDRFQDRDQGFFDRTRDQQSRLGFRQGQSDGERSSRNFRSHQDDHYRSWRDNQIRALDRDYEDYCREREQQFHQDFDSWRQNRQPSVQSGSQEPVMELTTRAPTAEPMGADSSRADATLGTDNSQNNTTGRTRR